MNISIKCTKNSFFFLISLFASLLVSGCVSNPSSQGESSYTVIGVPEGLNKLGRNNCIAPFLCQPKGAPNYRYNNRQWGTPKFMPGSVKLRDGRIISGDIALLQKQRDWDFVKHIALIQPAGSTEAIYIGPGDAFSLTQIAGKQSTIYDMYGTMYLQRLVSGKKRLSYNPAAGTSEKLVDFLPPGLVDGVVRELSGREVMAAIKDGKSLREVSKSGTTSGVLINVASSVEITEKEYIYYNENTEKITLITKSNFEEVVGALYKQCGKSFSLDYDDIIDAFKYLNGSCS